MSARAPFLPRLIVVSDAGRLGVRQVLSRWEVLARASAPGSVALQLRDRQLPTTERLALGRALRLVATRLGQELIVNDALDLCLELKARAVHLGEGSVSPDDVRRLWQSQSLPLPWIACAVHPSTKNPKSAPGFRTNAEEAPSASDALARVSAPPPTCSGGVETRHEFPARGTRQAPHDCEAWIVSPVMAPRKERAALGLEGLSACVARAPSSVRIYALGGITASSAPACLAQGAAGVAVIEAALGWDTDPLALVTALGIARH